jgi:hypothetical protein
MINMRDNRISEALDLIVELISDLNNTPKNNFDFDDKGQCVCLECGSNWYRKHSHNCKSMKINRLVSIAESFEVEN